MSHTHIQNKVTKIFTTKKNLFNLSPFVILTSLVVIFITFNLKYGIYLLVAIGLLVFFVKRKWLLYAIILCLFLEADIFSFYFINARIRVVQIIEIIGICYLVIWFISGKMRLKKTHIDLPLWGYIGINFFALINADWINRSIKIALLLLSLGLLYYLVYNLFITKYVFDKAFNLLLYIGLAEIIYGLYQVFAGMLNYYLRSNLFIGHLGIVHKEYLLSPWGRPYGTFVEPDWYGTICLFYSILFITLYYSKLNKKKAFYFTGLILSILGLLFSFVRAAWIGFIVALIVLLFLKHKSSLLKFNLALYIKYLFVLFLLLFLLIILYPSFRNIIKERIYPTYTGARFSIENIRAQKIETSFKFFLKRPIIGNGPGSAAFNYYAENYGKKYAKSFVKDKTLAPKREAMNPSIIITTIEDTGITGLALFLILIGKIVSYNIKMISIINNKYSIFVLGLFSGLVGLFTSYIFTQGFWLPFTWVFLAFNMSAIRIGILEKHEKFNHKNNKAFL